MIEKVLLVFNKKRIMISPIVENSFKISFSIPAEYLDCSFDLEIIFKNSIEGIRNRDYQWVLPKENFIAANLVPKILKLSNGFFVQPNSMLGIWEFSKKANNKIIWKLNHTDVAVIAKYQGSSYQKKYCQIKPLKIVNPLVLFFSKNGALEFSRSKIPFSAVACFTDHCDFDTVENLRMQRNLLTKSGVKVTKGFFLNHFSKRANNASWENNSDELKQWLEDGHELAYHSLSQSIKSNEASKIDFMNFKQVENVVSWIDHGFQPYNFSLYENTKIVSQKDYFEKLKTEKITTLWNYIDSGTSTTGVLNQLNSDHFTLERFWRGNKSKPILNRIQTFVKNCFVHYYADEKLIDNYKVIVKNIKDIFLNYKIREFLKLFKNSIAVSYPLLKVVLFWNSCKKESYRFAKYNSIIFRYANNENTFTVFQTLEMLDFSKSLSPENVDLFIKEKGFFIAHTYFSVPLKYHLGRMFLTENSIDQKVADNFIYLGQKIKNEEIWNPTLNELILFLDDFDKIVLDVDDLGNIYVVNEFDIPFRKIN